MREVIEARPEHDQAGARPAAPARPRHRPPNDFWAQGNHYDHRPELLAGLARRL